MTVSEDTLHPGWSGLVCLGLLLTACGEAPAEPFDIAGHRYDSAHVTYLALARHLREISGLEIAGPGKVYAHNDEHGVIYVIDYETPHVDAITLTCAAGDDVRDDFEGIAAVGERVFLVTSQGLVYESRVDGTPDSVPVIRHAGGLDCEVEGLAAAPDGRSLLVACKNLPKGGSGIVIHAWNLERQAYEASPVLSIPEETVTDFLTSRFPDRPPPKRIQPTGIALTGKGNLLLVAARQHLLLEFTQEGTPLAAAALDPAVFRQAEGVTVDAVGRLLVASEGDGKGDKKTPGMLSVYEPID